MTAVVSALLGRWKFKGGAGYVNINLGPDIDAGNSQLLSLTDTTAVTSTAISSNYVRIVNGTGVGIYINRTDDVTGPTAAVADGTDMYIPPITTIIIPITSGDKISCILADGVGTSLPVYLTPVS